MLLSQHRHQATRKMQKDSVRGHGFLTQQYHIQNIMVCITLLIKHLPLKKINLHFLLYQLTKLAKYQVYSFKEK